MCRNGLSQTIRRFVLSSMRPFGIGMSENREVDDDQGDDDDSFGIDTSAFREEGEMLRKEGMPIFLCYATLTALNQMIWIQMAPIKDKVVEHFDIKESMSNVVDVASIDYNVVYLLLFLPSSYLLERKGLRFGLILAAALNAMGAFLRFFAALGDGNFTIVLIGQTLCAMCQPLTFASPSKIARRWFPSRTGWAVGLAWAATYFGMCMGLLLPR